MQAIFIVICTDSDSDADAKVARHAKAGAADAHQDDSDSENDEDYKADDKSSSGGSPSSRQSLLQQICSANLINVFSDSESRSGSGSGRNSLITRQSTTQTDVIYLANINVQSVVASVADDSLQ